MLVRFHTFRLFIRFLGERRTLVCSRAGVLVHRWLVFFGSITFNRVCSVYGGGTAPVHSVDMEVSEELTHHLWRHLPLRLLVAPPPILPLTSQGEGRVLRNGVIIIF